MKETLSDRLKTLVEERGVTPRKASLAATGNGDTIRIIIKQNTRNPRSEVIDGLAAYFGVEPRWLLTGEGERQAAALAGQHSKAEVLDAPRSPPTAADSLSVPVLGSAAGSFFGAIQYEGAVIDYVDRPVVLRMTDDAYAIYVTGSSMEPEHKQGDLRFIHPGKPPRFGDSVVVQTGSRDGDPPEAYIGHLKRMSGDEVVLGKLNPPSELTIPRRYVRLVHRVLTMNELFGR